VDQFVTKSSLAPESAHLVELMQAVNYGRIEDLVIRSGQPVFDPAPRIIEKLKIGGDNGPRPEIGCPDFRLKGGVVELLELLARLGDGEVRLIEIRCGLPVSAEIEWASDAKTGITTFPYRSR
jgi:hypothetical protein